MSRIRHAVGVLLAGTLLATSSAVAQDAPTLEVPVRAQMAAITLDSAGLPGDYVFSAETFLTADQVAIGEVTADDLTGAGFLGFYASTYTNPDSGYEITSYVSAWNDAEAAESGFGLLEDEARVHPDGTFEDAEAGVGEAPGETTTGTYPDSDNAEVTISTVDVTFRSDRFLVGVALETRDGTPADAETVKSLAGALEGRATAAIGNTNPDSTDLALPAQALPLSATGVVLQAGFLSPQEVEQMYGLQGSALGSLTASWNEVVGLGEGDAPQPYVSVSVTGFGNDEDAGGILEQVADLAPELPNAEAVDGVEVEGADAVAAYRFPSLATGATEADSFRLYAVAGSQLVVIDVQGAPSVDAAQESASQLATAQVGCLGATSCAAPELPASLTGA